MAATLGDNTPPSHIGGLENLDEEHSYWIDDIEGEVPTNLVGTFFRNGPGRQRIGDTPYGHWFDGDGMLCAFTFHDGKAHFKNAYVRTPKYVEETQAQKVLYRGFGTQLPGGFLKNFGKMPANPANTNTMYHGGKLLALNEGGKPWELDPADLTTVGEYNYDGALEASQAFSAHGKIHPSTGDYINFAAGVSGRFKPCLHVYRIDSSGKLTKKTSLPLDTFPFCHDFALTERYAVFFLGSIVFEKMFNVIIGRKTIADQIAYDSSVPLRILCVDLDTLEIAHQFESDAGAIVHFGNAFEENGSIVVDAMYQDDFAAADTLSNVFDPEGRFNGGLYNRYRLETSSGQVSVEQVSELESEFPTYNTDLTGSRHDVCYTACSIDNGANGFFNAFQRVTFDGDSELVSLRPGLYGSEPLFAPANDAKAEDDGYVLDVVYDGYEHLSELQIRRAQNIGDQVCRLRLKHHLPHQFHGYFSREVFC